MNEGQGFGADNLVEIIAETDDSHALAYEMRQLINKRRQFAVTFDGYGVGTISAPKIGARDPKTPQPQPPLEQAIAVAA